MKDPTDIEIKVDIKLRWSLPAIDAAEDMRRNQDQVAADITAHKFENIISDMINILKCT